MTGASLYFGRGKGILYPSGDFAFLIKGIIKCGYIAFVHCLDTEWFTDILPIDCLFVVNIGIIV